MASWAALHLVGLPRADLDWVTTVLLMHGAQGLQEEWLPGQRPPPIQPWESGVTPRADPLVLIGWFESPDRAAIAHALTSARAELQWHDVMDTDWSAMAQRGHSPIHISERLIVAPPWEADEGTIVIEPGLGFGTGQHPTTQQALHAIDRLADQHRTLLDVGSGSGILALAAASLGLESSGIEIDELALGYARRAAESNGVRVTFSNTPIQDLPGPYDLVVANLHAELIVQLAPELLRVTNRTLVLAGILEDRASAVRAAIGNEMQLLEEQVSAPWVSLWYARA